MGVTGWFHVGITVGDMAAAIAFYRDGLGFEVDWETVSAGDEVRELIALDFESIRNVFMKIPGGGRVELLEYRGIERGSGAARTCDPGSGHLALFVDDIEATIARARLHGGTTRSSDVVITTEHPGAGTKAVYVADPDGFVIELFQRPPRSEGTPVSSRRRAAAG
jgi:lactoylglutathione lyase